jgi:hypothetical protein
VSISTIPSGVVGQPITFTGRSYDDVVDETVEFKSMTLFVMIWFLADINDINLVSLLIKESHSGRVIPHTITPAVDDNKRQQITFTPMIARQHTIIVSSGNQHLSTHYVDIFNVNKIRVCDIHDGLVGRPSIFTVDTHGAGEGHLEVTISDGRRTLPAELKKTQARKFDIGFVPEINGRHSVTIAFNGVQVQGSPFIIHVRHPSMSDKGSTDEDDDNDDDMDDHEFLIGGQLQGTKVGELAWLICNTPLSDIYEDFNFFITGEY